MKNNLLITILSFSLLSFAQTKGYVYYGGYKSINWGPRNSPEERGNLIFDLEKQESLYYTGKDSLNILFTIENSKLFTENKNQTIFYNKNYEIEDCFERIYISKDSMKSYFKWGSKKYGNVHYFKEKKPLQNWKLENESKKIGNYICYKATCNFRGRTYIAWYTLEIPLPYGPWKLQGLPGLILEAYIPNEEIYYYAKKIIVPLDFTISIPKIEIVKGYKWMTNMSELLKRQEDLTQDAYEESVLIIESLGNSNAKAVKNTPKDVFNEFEE